MPVDQAYEEQTNPTHFNYCAFNVDGIFARHVNISGSDSVTRTVCSKWAES